MSATCARSSKARSARSTPHRSRPGRVPTAPGGGARAPFPGSARTWVLCRHVRSTMHGGAIPTRKATPPARDMGPGPPELSTSPQGHPFWKSRVTSMNACCKRFKSGDEGYSGHTYRSDLGWCARRKPDYRHCEGLRLPMRWASREPSDVFNRSLMAPARVRPQEPFAIVSGAWLGTLPDGNSWEVSLPRPR